jgi:diacylglycerol kinase
MKGFKFALNGIKEAIATQVNFRFHFAATLFVVSAGFVVELNEMEWVMVTLCIGFVVVTELLNTAIEYLVDFISPDQHPLAGKIKDLAAGAVLISAITAFVTGLIIFTPKIMSLF